MVFFSRELGVGTVANQDLALSARTSPCFRGPASAEEALRTLGVRFDPMGRAAACRAGSLWRAYRERGGARSRVVADFLVGAHAIEQADRLLSRDRGFFRDYLPGLTLVDAGQASPESPEA